MNERLHLVFCLLIFGTSGLVSQSAEPDTIYAMPPVLVTATKVDRRSAPVTFSNLEGTDIRTLYSTQDIPVLLSALPSVTTYSENGSGIGYNYINLRGFDQRRMSIMVNGVPQNDPEDHNVYWVDFPDLLANTQEIQVQRGAGSAFYGPPAIGGSVNILANPFRERPTVTLESMFGFQEFGAQKETKLLTSKYSVGANSGWVGDRYLLFGRLSRIRTDGYRDMGWVDLTSYFVGLMRVDASMTTRFHAYGGPIADGLSYVGLPKEFNKDVSLRRTNFSYWEYDSTGNTVGFAVPQKVDAKENFSQPHYELIHDWNVSPTLSLHTTAFYVRGDGFFDYDGDWIPYTSGAVDWFQQNVGYSPAFGTLQFPTFLFRGAVENRQWGLLPRVEIVHDGGRITLGLEARVHRSHHYGRIVSTSQPPTPSFDLNTKVYEYDGVRDIFSMFVHDVYDLRPNMSLVGDLQVVHTSYGIRNERYRGTAFDVAYTFVNPRVGVNVNMTEELNAYAFVGYTSREPRLRNLYAAEDAFFGAMPEFEADTSGGVVRYDFSSPHAKPEQLLNVELGAGWRGEDAQITATLFWMEFTNELVKSGKVDIFGQPVTGNADRTRHIGLELEATMRVMPHLRVSGNATVSRNRIVSYTTYESGVPFSLDGNVIAGFPDIMGNVRVTYDDGTTTADVALQAVGEFYTDNTMNARNRNDAYGIINFTCVRRIDLTGTTAFGLRAEVRNLTNELYTSGGEGNSFFPAAERNYLLGITLTL